MPTTITDDFMRAMGVRARPYAVLILKKGPRYRLDAEKRIIWEHGRRNHALRTDGVLSIVCPILDDSDYAGIGVFNCSVDAARRLMEDDPAVKAGVLTFEIHPSRGFPGDALPS